MKYFAHSAPDSKEQEGWHLLSEHLQGTGELAAEFLAGAGLDELGRAAGLLHDLGKYTPEFQERLAGGMKRVNHSTAGAQMAMDRYGSLLGKMLAFPVAGHHAGLANGVNGERTGALNERLNESVPELDPAWESEITLPGNEALSGPLGNMNAEDPAFSCSFLIRLLFSALVDADFLDTEAYYDEGKATRRGQHPDIAELQKRLDEKLEELVREASKNELNALRHEVLTHARDMAGEAPGGFTLTVPTGGGKTLTSLAFALDHAVRHGLERVIYVIPFTSIVEQTAEVFRGALGKGAEEFVIEHHSTFDEEQIGKREAKDKLRLAMENWDAPVIVTTAVQFFESLFANRPSRCRKLHNIVNSVVILDEAQTLPLSLLRPCVAALKELIRHWRVSIVLCTATQPALGGDGEDGFEGGFEGLRELAPDPMRLQHTLKRTDIRFAGHVEDDALAERLREARQVLCIVNTRRHARELFESLKDSKGAYHLTTAMCARHRQAVLRKIRKRLENDEEVRLVATSLIEAGVDIDFPTVWRAEAGLESIIQAAGRCNREGKRPTGEVFVFQPEEGRKPPPEIAQFAAAMRGTVRQHGDPQSLEAIDHYFREVYWLRGEQLDKHRILHGIEMRRPTLDFPFETMAKQFRLIETPMVPVIVRYRGADGSDDTVDRSIEALQYAERPGQIARKLQPYIVQIPPKARETLVTAGTAMCVREDDFADQFVVVNSERLYRDDIGLRWDDSQYETLIV